MGMKTLPFLMILSSLLINYGTKGVEISKQEELEWDKQFKLLKKPSVKLIKTNYGDLYDCVDFYKQPAFDHPLLKNHSSHPQIRPSFSPFDPKDEAPIERNTKLEDEGCPLGTVPIKRLSKDEFFRIKRFTKYYASRSMPNSIEDLPGTQLAVVETNSDSREENYKGVRCKFNVYDPEVKQPQHSSGLMIIQNFEDRIQVGWTGMQSLDFDFHGNLSYDSYLRMQVNPGLNNDNRTHLFQFLNAGQSRCFNLLCPGFVSTSSNYPIDMAYNGVSVRGGDQGYIQTSVYQDPNTGHWWLELRDGRYSYAMVGYWPREIFTVLGDSASYIAVGGEAYSPQDQPLAPMGNGYFPKADAKLSACCARFAVLDENHKVVDPDQTDLLVYDSHYGVYDVTEYADLGRTVFFGGTTRD